MKFTVLTLFPELFPGPLGASLVGNALKENKWQLGTVNIRDFAHGKHKLVDDTPYGGGAGMVIRPDVLSDTIESVQDKPDKWVYLSPRGELWNQRKSEAFLEHQHIGLIAARYEGIDQRIIDFYDIEELSIGDYVLSGGEIAAYCVIDTCIRQVFSVLGNPQTIEEESFGGGDYQNLLEYPHFTRPSSWNDMNVPEVLQSGNHQRIAQWRLEKAQELTKARRPDVWQKHNK